MKRFLAALKLLLTLKCEQSSHLVSQSMDRDLSLAEKWAVRLHQLGCWSCRRFGKQIRQIKEVLRAHPSRTVDSVGLSPDALQRIQNAIKNESS